MIELKEGSLYGRKVPSPQIYTYLGLTSGSQHLFSAHYPRLHMITDRVFTENDVNQLLIPLHYTEFELEMVHILYPSLR